jgi:hypothetical protein
MRRTRAQSTTFVHSKYVMVDNTLASVSSVNWSPNSFTNNREAGLLLKGSGAGPALKFLTSVFDADWAAGATFTPAQTYSAADMKIITDTAVRQVVVPQGPTNRSYVTPKPSLITESVANFTVLTSPDWSYDTIMDALNAATKSVQIYIYQITDPRVCDAVQALHGKLDLTLLVSKAIYDATDQARDMVTAGSGAILRARPQACGACYGSCRSTLRRRACFALQKLPRVTQSPRAHSSLCSSASRLLVPALFEGAIGTPRFAPSASAALLLACLFRLPPPCATTSWPPPA